MNKRFKLLLLSLLGFASACNERQVCMYGSPSIDFKAQGRVTDRAGNPIPGIDVRQSERNDGTTTAADGSFGIEGETFPYEVTLRFTDPDGEANGGDFRTQEVAIEFSKADRTHAGDGSWYKGSYAREGIEVVLEEKE